MHETNIRFWIAVIGAVLIKILMSKNLKPMNAALTMFAGIYSGWAFTGFFIDLLKLESSNQNVIIVAGLVAMSGENLLRQLINFSNSENLLSEIWKLWRGGDRK